MGARDVDTSRRKYQTEAKSESPTGQRRKTIPERGGLALTLQVRVFRPPLERGRYLHLLGPWFAEYRPLETGPQIVRCYGCSLRHVTADNTLTDAAGILRNNLEPTRARRLFRKSQ